jgi:hypothetical protein
MRSLLGHLVIALAITLVVGLLSGGGWAFVVGAALSLSLWVMLFAGSYAGPARAGRTSVRDYAMAAIVAVALGYVMFLVGDNASFWAVGFILGGVIVPAGSAARRDLGTGSAGDGAGDGG